MAIETTILFDVGVIILSATILAIFAKFLRQPLLAAYILAGIIIGPEILGIVRNTEVIQMFAELGVAFLLFMVGLELDLSRLREVRYVVLGAALAEVMLLFSLGYFAMYFLGFTGFDAIYTGLFLAFSSTAVIVKILADRRDIDTLHGRIVLGILLIQDIIVVLALSVLTTLNDPGITPLVSALIRGAGLLALAVVLSKYVFPLLLKQIDDSHELVFLTSVAVLFGFVGIAVESGFSTAVGGFIAGISLTTFPYNIEISERARPLRDFFVTVFFVSLGMLVSLQSLWELRVPFLILLGITLFFKPFILDLMVSLFQYGKRTSFYTGLSLAQISEFSMVLALTGLNMGHIGRGIFSLATALMVVSIISTSYTVKYQRDIYHLVEGFLFEREGARYEEKKEEREDHIVLCGSHIKGRKILQLLEEKGEEVVVIDYDPEIISWAKNNDFNAVYGDIEDIQTLDRADVAKAKTVVSTVPDEEDNRFLLNYIEENNPDILTILSANDIESALLMYDEGADYVLYPKMLAAQEASDMVEKLYRDGKTLEDARKRHIENLEEEFEEEILKRFEPDFMRDLKDRIRGLNDGRDSERS
ncbi:MAG: cation:proton antiporter [Candidatus Nanohaloarchaeota archaeon QJJ-7]|nr:cation:proton antiporter [Candidatus Nanohaloarchaeota archaeon QJJ-7]